MKFGIIRHRNISKSMFVVKLDDDSFTIFESFNVNEFNVNDRVSGQLDKCGFFNILNATTQKSQLVLIQGVALTESDAMNKVNLPE